MGIDTKKYIEGALSITDKLGQTVPLKFNAAQQKLYDIFCTLAAARKPIRVIVLKARQMGFSTLVQAVLFKQVSTHSNTRCAIVAHSEQATANIFEKAKFFYQTMTPPQLRPQLKASNAQEIKYGVLNSSIRCYTAGGASIGRGETIQNLHLSELAFWTGDKASTMLGIVQAVPNTPNSMIVIESTANGYDYFKDLWDKAISGESDYVPLFVGWHEMDEYRMEYDGFELTQEEERLKRTYSLDNEQLAWRRWCIKNNCGGDMAKFKQEYPINADEAFIASGDCVFDQASIIRRIEQLHSTAKPTRRGEFEYKLTKDAYGEHISDIEWVDKSNGAISIYAQPQRGYPYVISGDTAGEGSDYFVGQVLNNITGEQTATIRHQFDEDMYAKQMYCLGKYYNNALIGIEANISTYAIRCLSDLGYTNQFVRETVDSISHKLKQSHGFKTTSITRPIIIGEFIKIAREHIELINDEVTLREMLTFVRNEKGRAEAIQGKHDDTVMAMAIAHHIRPQGRTYIEAEKVVEELDWMYQEDNDSDDEGSYIDDFFN